MAEKSIFWTTGSTGDGASAYTQAEVIRWMRQMMSGGDNEGVQKSYQNELAVTGSSSPVSVNTGAALVYGFPYWNTAAVTVAVPTPVANTRIDRIVLRADWSAQTVRITRIAGTEGLGTPPALTQVDSTTWDIPLARASITTGGVITLTDEREWLNPNIEVNAAMLAAAVAGDGLQGGDGSALAVDVSDFAGTGLEDDGSENVRIAAAAAGNGLTGGGGSALAVNVDDSTIEISSDALRVKADGIDDTKVGNRVPQFYRRQGGNASAWDVPGVTTYTPTTVRMQAGAFDAGNLVGAASHVVAVTFPTAFSQPPVVVATLYNYDDDSAFTVWATMNVTTITASGFKVVITIPNAGGPDYYYVNWIAVGPE